MSSYEDKIRHLWKRAQHPNTPDGERDACETVMQSLARKHGENLEDILVGLREDQEATLDIRWKQRFERELLVHLATHLGLTAQFYPAARGRSRKVIVCTGPSSLIYEWSRLYDFHRGAVERQIEATLTGYLHGVAPIVQESESSSRSTEPELTESEREAMLSAYERGLGERGSAARALSVRSITHQQAQADGGAL